jgi:2-iminobutanoate/2-iminopropanoate deaminase
MNFGTFTRRNFAGRLAAVLSSVGLTGAVLAGSAQAATAHDSGPAEQFEIGHHTTIVMDNVKKLVETGGGTVDSILQLTVFLADIKYYDGMNKIFKAYFPNGGPARTTVAVAALPGNSLVEINCIAVVVKK